MQYTRTLLLAGSLLLAGCAGEPTDAGRPAAAVRTPLADRDNDHDRDREHRSVERDLATLRRVTAPFHRFDAATQAGWAAKITGCMFSSQGGMGFHYGNPTLINDGVARVDQPDLLLYEPEKNGKLRLVAVEYVILYSAHPRDAAPPVLFGQSFKQNDTFQLWGLHAWVWKENPRGIFADWNPRVSCANTTDVMPM